MKHELNWAHNTIFVFPPLFVCMPLHLLDALALVLKDDRCRCHILDLLGISGKTKSGTDKGNLYHCIRSYQQIKDHQRSSKHIKVCLINRWAKIIRICQDEPKSGDSPWFSIQILSPGLLEPGVHQFVARRFHLLLAGHTGAACICMLLWCCHVATARGEMKDKKG